MTAIDYVVTHQSTGGRRGAVLRNERDMDGGEIIVPTQGPQPIATLSLRTEERGQAPEADVTGLRPSPPTTLPQAQVAGRRLVPRATVEPGAGGPPGPPETLTLEVDGVSRGVGPGRPLPRRTPDGLSRKGSGVKTTWRICGPTPSRRPLYSPF